MAQKLDRSTEDLGNIVALEHVNVQIPDQRLSTLFYVAGLGLTRDPYLMTSTNNMWVNIGRSQFHLPTGEPQRLRGRVGLVIPDPRRAGPAAQGRWAISSRIPSSTTPRRTTMSTRPARGATGSGCTSPTSVSDGCAWAWPMSARTSRSAAPPA